MAKVPLASIASAPLACEDGGSATGKCEFSFIEAEGVLEKNDSAKLAEVLAKNDSVSSMAEVPAMNDSASSMAEVPESQALLKKVHEKPLVKQKVVMMCRKGDGSDYVKHMYKYRSSGVQGHAMLYLHEMPGPRLLCEFLCRGNHAPPHGDWRISKDGASLRVRFNYQFEDDGTHNVADLPFHPSVMDRDPVAENDWTGYDDKGCTIEMEHCRSLIRDGRSWYPTEPL